VGSIEEEILFAFGKAIPWALLCGVLLFGERAWRKWFKKHPLKNEDAKNRTKSNKPERVLEPQNPKSINENSPYWEKKPTTPKKGQDFRTALIGSTILAAAAVIGIFLEASSPPQNDVQEPSRQVELSALDPQWETSKQLPDQFKRIELTDYALALAIPENWERWDDQYFRDARSAAAGIMNRNMHTGEPVYSAASIGTSGAPLAIVQILIEPGPAPTQRQLRELLQSGDTGVTALPDEIAKQFRDMDVPGISLEVLESQWVDNGTAICQYMSAEVARNGSDGQTLRQWQCFNSSTVIWLTMTSPSIMDAIYSNIASVIWDSFDFRLDQTVRLRLK